MSLTAGFHPSYYADDSSYYDDYYGYDDDDYNYYDDGSYDDSYDHDGFFDEDGNYYQHDGYGNYYDEDNDEYYDDGYDHGYGQGYGQHDPSINNYYDSHNYNSNYTHAPNHSHSMSNSNHYYGGGGRGMHHSNGYGQGGRGGGYGGYHGGGYGGYYQPSPVRSIPSPDTTDESHAHNDPEQFEFHEAPQEQHEEMYMPEPQPVFPPPVEPRTRSATIGPYLGRPSPRLRPYSEGLSTAARPSPERPPSAVGMGVLGRAHSVMWRSPPPQPNNANEQRVLPRLSMPAVPDAGNQQQKPSPLSLFHNRFWRSSSSPSSSRPRTPHSPQDYYTPLEAPNHYS